jgi:DNA-binding transcriptional MerR regulator
LWYRDGKMSHARIPIGDAAPRLLKINEVAAETGLTTRTIRYYEEVGLLEPAARSEGDYRLYDASDLDRLQFIRSLRDDAGFSLAQIGQMLEDEDARARNRERLRETNDPAERRLYLAEALERVERQIGLLEAKQARLGSMIDEAQARLGRIRTGLAELDATERSPRAPTSPASEPAS